MFEDYVSIYGSSTSYIVFGTESDSSCVGSESELAGRGKSMSLLKAKFKKHKIDSGLGGSKGSELEIYPSESILDENAKFDILK